MRKTADKIYETDLVASFNKDMESMFGAEHIIIITNRGDTMAFHYNKKNHGAMVRILSVSLEYLLGKDE